MVRRRCPTALRERIVGAWGDPPGALYVDGDGTSCSRPAVRQRGADDPATARFRREPDRDLPRPGPAADATTTSPPTAGWSAVRRRRDRAPGQARDAGVAAGQGARSVGGCAPDAVLGDLPLVYPFIVNDPGEGTQAKRRGHATVVDHLVPPMARADTYGELAKLEQLLDEHATRRGLDPAKLRPSAARSGSWSRPPAASRPARRRAPARTSSTSSSCTSTAISARSRTYRSATGCTSSAARPTARRVNLVLAVLRAHRSGAATGAPYRACARRSLGVRPRRDGRCWPSRVPASTCRQGFTALADGPPRSTPPAGGASSPWHS